MHQIEAEAKDDDDGDNNNEQFFNIGSLVNCNSLKSKINAYLTMKDFVKYKILFNLGTGAEVNIISKKFIDKMSLTLDATKITLSGIGNGIFKPCGNVILDCFNDNNECHSLLFYVSDKIDHAILGAKACFDLNFLKRVETCHKRELKTPLLLPDICNVCSKFQNKHQCEPIIFFFFFFYLYIYPPDSQESDGGAIHRVRNYPDLLPEMPRYCCPLVI